jgi:MarR family transcriptional regulator, organic hydroperoxide resistance regulator
MEHEGRLGSTAVDAPMPKTRGIAIDRYLPYLVNRALRAMRGYSEAVFDELGLSIPTFRILFALSELGTQRFGALVTATSLEPPTLSRFLNELEAERLVKRTRALNGNAKAVDVTLTAAGVATVARAMPTVIECETVYLAGVSAADANVARRVMHAIYENARTATAARAQPAPRRRTRSRLA